MKHHSDVWGYENIYISGKFCRCVVCCCCHHIVAGLWALRVFSPFPCDEDKWPDYPLCQSAVWRPGHRLCNYAAGQRRPSINISIGVSLFSINQRSFHMNTSLSLRTKSLKRCQNVTTVKKTRKKIAFWVMVSDFWVCLCRVAVTDGSPAPELTRRPHTTHSLPVQSEMASTKVRHCRAQQHWQTLCRGPAAGSRKADRCYRG